MRHRGLTRWLQAALSAPLVAEATALLDLAYVQLALSNPVLALSNATKLLGLRGPAAPPQLQFIGHMYAAEALCHLNKPSEALEHIATGESTI